MTETLLIILIAVSSVTLVTLLFLGLILLAGLGTVDGEPARKALTRKPNVGKKKYAPKLHDDATIAQIEERLNEAARSAQPRGMFRRR